MPTENSTSQNTKIKENKSFLKSVGKGAFNGFIFANENMATIFLSPIFVLGGAVAGGIKSTASSLNNNKKYELKKNKKMK